MDSVSHATTWEDRGSLMNRLQTNLSAGELLGGLARSSRTGAAEAVEEHQDLLRLNGGPYLVVRWDAGVGRGDVRELLSRAGAWTAATNLWPEPSERGE